MSAFKPKMRKAGVAALCLMLSLSLSACWSQREMDTLAIVIGTAVDVGELPDTSKLTAQVVIASNIKSSAGSGGGKEGKAYTNVSYTSPSMQESIHTLSRTKSRTLYFAHNEILIFGSDLAKVDMGEGIDAFTRDYESRINSYVLIAQGKASDILDVDVDMEKTPSQHIAKVLKNQKMNLGVVVVTLRDFTIAMLSKTTSPVAPILRLYTVADKKEAKIEGTAVFKNGKMVGELDTAQTRGLMWIMEKQLRGDITVETIWGQVALEITNISNKLRPNKASDGSIYMTLDLDINAVILGNETDRDMLLSQNVGELKNAVNQFIYQDISNVMLKARELSADVFGFGEIISRELPDEWENVEKDWEKAFLQTGLNVNLNAEIRSEGSITKPIMPGGAQ